MFNSPGNGYNSCMLRTRTAGMVFLLASALSMSFVSFLVKLAVRAGVPAGHAIFGRFVAGLVLISILTAAMRHPFRSGHVRDLVLRGLFTSGSVICLFYGVALGSMTNSVILFHTRPLFTVLMASKYIGETPRRRDYAGVFLALAGVVFILRPAGLNFQTVDLLGLAAALCSALALLTVRKLRRTESSLTILFWLMLVGVVFTAPLAVPHAALTSHHGMALLLAIGALATASQIMLTFSYKAVDAPSGSITASTAVVFAAALGHFLLGEALNVFTLIGIFSIISANALVSVKQK